jgi:tRNA threonylcarbamoyladenosine biosynthesis protein TsaE
MELYFNLEELQWAAGQVLEFCGKPSVLACYGEMGAGKTTLIKALCQQLKVIDTVDSPTFSIINQYQTSNGQTIYHLDLYRLNSVDEAILAGVEDCLLSGNWCFVEWPEKTPALFDDTMLQLRLQTLGHQNRALSIFRIS